MNQEIITELFLPHPKYPDYWFSNMGRAVSTKGKTPRPLKGTVCGQLGYKAICVYGQKKVYIHRVVCELFNGNPQDGQQCRHLDGNRFNNKASNLKWGWAVENAADKILHGTNSEGVKNPMAKLTPEIVQQIRRVRDEEQLSYSKLAKRFNVSTMTAFRAATQRSWK